MTIFFYINSEKKKSFKDPKFSIIEGMDNS